MADPGSTVVLLVDRVAGPERATALRALVGALGARGRPARVLCSSWGDSDHRGLAIEERPGLGDRWRLPWALRSFRAGAFADRPLLIHVLEARMAEAGLEVAEKWEIPYIQGVEEFLAPGARLRLSRRWCRGLLTTSRAVADDLTREFGVPRGWVRVVPTGIAAPDPAPGRGLGADRRISVVGAAGPLAAGSGFSTFLNAARRVLDAGVDAEFVLVGQGEEEGDLRRRAERLRIADRLTFAADSAVGLSYWDVLDVYCQPSTVPTVGEDLARALAHGLPAVASDIEGLRALVDDQVTGLRVPPGDTNALARAILELLGDPRRARRLGQEGRDAVLRDHDPAREADALVDLYDETARREPVAVAGSIGPT